ncbi:hypothetical protein LIER_13363 [Lithospermum erythrorhizon]|uniref:Uncharacterized protein n=1 Tax=Lithospermum erythrorhizon TaxID=34254 RepID=A0AAV3PZB1_LITER
MVSFSTEGEHHNLHLHIHDHEEDKDTLLAAHPPLYRGCCPPWEALSGKDAGGDMSWTPGEPSRQSVLAGRGHSRDEPLKIYRILREDVAIGHWAWHSSIALHGLFEYTPGYWEWAESVLSRCSAKLSTTSIYEGIRASLFTYEYSDTNEGLCGMLESIH